MEERQKNQFFYLVGGRKQFNGYIAAILLTAMAPFLKASFPEYSLGILGALGLTSGLIALEDRDGKRYSRKTEIQAVTTGTEQNGFNQDLTAFKLSQKQGSKAIAEQDSSLENVN